MTGETPPYDSDEATISPELVKAYTQTDYHVLARPPFILKINQYNPDLLRLHDLHEVKCSTYITACNPQSTLVSARTNREKMQTLAICLASRGFSRIAGFARDPDCVWPDEASLLVPGLTEDDARLLGTHFGQNAIVCMTEDAIPRLILLRHAEKGQPS